MIMIIHNIFEGKLSVTKKSYFLICWVLLLIEVLKVNLVISRLLSYYQCNWSHRRQEPVDEPC